MASSSSDVSTIASTLSNGIQNISALLPLLGTQQCEEHVVSALDKGYLYAAAAPLTIFGTLGVARAGFKTLIATISIPHDSFDFVGAKRLIDAGFSPIGTNLPSILPQKGNHIKGGFLIEDWLQQTQKCIPLDGANKISLSHEMRLWNIKLTLATLLASFFGLAPYAHLYFSKDQGLDPRFLRWIFPASRVIGGFLTSTMIQFLIQHRVIILARKRLLLNSLNESELYEAFSLTADQVLPWDATPSLDRYCFILNREVHKKLSPLLTKANETKEDDLEAASPTSPNPSPLPGYVAVTPERWEELQERLSHTRSNLPILFQILMFLGLVASIAGYVGSFSVVQNAKSSRHAIIWLVLETVLAILRMLIWSWNPDFDDGPAFHILELNANPPPPTCPSISDLAGSLPLVPAHTFLPQMVLFTGPVKPFQEPSITLYYALTSPTPPNGTDADPNWMLFIAIVGHSDRFTRLLARWKDLSTVGISTSPAQDFESDKPEFFITETKIKADHSSPPKRSIPLGGWTRRTPIMHGNDFIIDDPQLASSLENHYQSIVDGLRTRNSRHCTLGAFWSFRPPTEPESSFQRLPPTIRVDPINHTCHNRYHIFAHFENNVYILSENRKRWLDDYQHLLFRSLECFIQEAHASGVTLDKNLVARYAALEYALLLMLVLHEQSRWMAGLQAQQRTLESFLQNHSGWPAETLNQMFRRFKRRSREASKEWKGAVEFSPIHQEHFDELYGNYLASMAELAPDDEQPDSHIFIEVAEDLSRRFQPQEDSAVEPASFDWVDTFFDDLRHGRFEVAGAFQTESHALDETARASQHWYTSWKNSMESRIWREKSQSEVYLEDPNLGLQHYSPRSCLWGYPLQKGNGSYYSLEFHMLISRFHSHSNWCYLPEFECLTMLTVPAAHLCLLLDREEPISHLSLDIRHCQEAHFESLDRILTHPNILSISVSGLTPVNRSFFQTFQFSSNLLGFSAIHAPDSEPIQLPENFPADLIRNQTRLADGKKTVISGSTPFMQAIEPAGQLFGEETRHVAEWIGKDGVFVVSFWGPACPSLELELVHRSTAEHRSLAVTEVPEFLHPIPCCQYMAHESITISNCNDEQTGLLFVPNHRNTFTFRVLVAREDDPNHDDSDNGYRIRQVRLLDENGSSYQPAQDSSEERKQRDSEDGLRDSVLDL